jgi:DNA-binding NtrC family response regulator
MSAQTAQASGKPRLLFVDDEQRVLNSMRIMFRKQFDLFLASHGAEALDIVKRQDIDVIIADHRMPQMTGVEVLTKVRALSPRTVRILLTGYADLDAIEGSINDGEVFRFLTKPCAPDQLRETISLAAKLAREAPIVKPSPAQGLPEEEVLEIITEGSPAPERIAKTSVKTAAPTEKPFDPIKTDVIERPASLLEPPAHAPAAQAPRPRAPQPAAGTGADGKPRLAAGLGVIVFSSDEEVLSTVQKAVRGRLPVHSASNIVQVVKILTDHRPGVLVTDVSDDKATIQAMTARLKEHLPELVTIAVSPHRDVLDMVWLINHGQIFRFLRKPLSTGRCAISLQAALKHHRMLLKNPALVKRHEVEATDDGGLMDGVLAKLKNVRRLWASV